jgi:hypothetical protein
VGLTVPARGFGQQRVSNDLDVGFGHRAGFHSVVSSDLVAADSESFVDVGREQFAGFEGSVYLGELVVPGGEVVFGECDVAAGQWLAVAE